MEMELDDHEFFKVDKISDDIYSIASNLVLKFNVSLSKTSSNGKRNHFHKEFEYSKSQEQSTLVTIKRSFDFYMSIENVQKDENGNKLFIRIGPQEYLSFKKALEDVILWYTDKKYKNLYAKDKKGNLAVLPPIPERVLTGLPLGKYLEFHPTVIVRGMSTADQEPGVSIYLSDPNNIVDISLNRFMGLYYLVSCMNMYQTAAELVNYLQRPSLGTNRFLITTGSRYSTTKVKEEPEGTSGINGRTIGPKNISNLEP